MTRREKKRRRGDICLVLWKSSFNGWITFEYIGVEILLITLILLNIQLICYSILMGICFQSSSRCLIVNLIVCLLMLRMSLKELNGLNEYLCCFNPYFTYLYLIRHLFVYERTMIKSFDISTRVYQWTNPLLTYYIYMISWILIYWFVLWYLDKINPGKNCFV